jgi:amino-acid N-acetyltransferase
MTKLAENDTNAVIGNWVRARGIGVRKGVDFQSSGLVEKLKIDIIQNVLQDGLVPIFPNIGWNSQGKPYNLSSNELAFTVARELHAAKLFFITDFGGISARGLSIPKGVDVSSEGFVSQLTVDETRKLIDANDTIAHGAMELAAFAYRACKTGVERVHIIDGRIEGMILKEIFSNRGFGTMIYANQFENIRPMAHADIPEVLSLMRPAIDDEILVPRTEEQLEQKLADYVVHEVDGTLHGCGAMHVFSGGKAEIAGIAVDETYGNQGVGRKIVSFLLEKASGLKLKKVFILTTQTADWFSKLGFVKADVADLPQERRQTYNKKRKSLVLAYTVGAVKIKKPLSMD